MRPKTILVEDSKLVSLCWKLEAPEGLEVFSTPHDLLENLDLQKLDADAVFVIDFDFAGLDVLSGIELSKRLRALGLRNRIYLYSGFSEIVPPELIASGIINGVHSKDLSPREVIAKLFAA